VKLEADRVAGQGITAQLARRPGAAAPAVPAWVRAVGASIRDLDARASVALPAAHLGLGPAAVDIEEGTTAEAEIAVRDGRIDPRGTRLGFDRPLDGPLWTDIRGATLTEDGRATVEVKGFPDPDVTRVVAWLLDLPERRIPLEVAELSAAVADRLAAGGGPGLPAAGIAVEAEASRVAAAELSVALGRARWEVGRAELEASRARFEDGALRGEIGRVEAERLVVTAVEPPRPVEVANAPEADAADVAR
jgi:hypothetical protein